MGKSTTTSDPALLSTCEATEVCRGRGAGKPIEKPRLFEAKPRVCWGPRLVRGDRGSRHPGHKKGHVMDQSEIKVFNFYMYTYVYIYINMQENDGKYGMSGY